MCEQADAVHSLMVDALEPLDAKERELTRLGYPLRPSKEYLRLQRYETRLRKVYNEAMHAFRQARAERIVGVRTDHLSDARSRADHPASRPSSTLEPEPEPNRARVESIARSRRLKENRSWRCWPPWSSRFGHDSCVLADFPDHPACLACGTHGCPSNRKARRAREKAARKHKAVAC